MECVHIVIFILKNTTCSVFCVGVRLKYSLTVLEGSKWAKTSTWFLITVSGR